MALGTMTKCLAHLHRELITWGFGMKSSRKVAVTKFMNYICAQLLRENIEEREFLPLTHAERRVILACSYYYEMRIRVAIVCPELSLFERNSIKEVLTDLFHHWIFFGPGSKISMSARPRIIYGRVYSHRSRLQKIKDIRYANFLSRAR